MSNHDDHNRRRLPTFDATKSPTNFATASPKISPRVCLLALSPQGRPLRVGEESGDGFALTLQRLGISRFNERNRGSGRLFYRDCDRPSDG